MVCRGECERRCESTSIEVFELFKSVADSGGSHVTGLVRPPQGFRHTEDIYPSFNINVGPHLTWVPKSTVFPPKDGLEGENRAFLPTREVGVLSGVRLGRLAPKWSFWGFLAILSTFDGRLESGSAEKVKLHLNVEVASLAAPVESALYWLVFYCVGDCMSWMFS